MPRFVFLLACLWVFAPALAGEPPSLSLPIACTPGRDCWVVNYFDHDHSKEFQDYRCSWRGYDGHTGIDISVGTLDRMNAGVSILAAADGTVIGGRDGEADKGIARGEVLTVKECGNGLRIDHGGGWLTQYCHLKQGSVRFQPGMKVRRGDVLGLVGLSGMTEFPHLHIEVQYKDKKHPIDPFTGFVASCKQAPRPLWDAAALAKMPYRPVQIFSLGAADRIPERAALQQGVFEARRIAASSEVFIVYFQAYGVPKGATLMMDIIAPDGTLFLRRTAVQERRQIQAYFYAGKKRGSAPWPRGTYRLIATVQQDETGKKETQEAEIKVY
ncbi:MAG: M23 family metallopeptidase [Holosporales bacterium]